jgi:hypothetical protein
MDRARGWAGLCLRENQRKEERLAAGSKKTKLGTKFEFRRSSNVLKIGSCASNKFGDGCLKNPWNGHGILFPRFSEVLNL